MLSGCELVFVLTVGGNLSCERCSDSNIVAFHRRALVAYSTTFKLIIVLLLSGVTLFMTMSIRITQNYCSFVVAPHWVLKSDSHSSQKRKCFLVFLVVAI